MALRTYDPAKHNASFGSIPIQGFAEGTYISVERISETYTSVAGSGGEVARVRGRDRRGSIKLTLMAVSPVNDALSSIAAQDELFGTGVRRFFIADSNGTTVCMAANAWIKKLPTVDFSKEMPNREWELECESLELVGPGGNIGGNF
jgi:hypothetical protein